MKPTRYVIKSGDTLWGISRKHYGDPTRWPELYAYNNQERIVAATRHRIVNPNLIRAGQVLFLPPKHRRIVHRHAPSGPSASLPNGGMPVKPIVPQQDTRNLVPLTKPGAAPGQERNPALDTIVNSFGFGYQFDDVPLMQVKGIGFTAVLKLRGTVFLQPSSQTPLIVYSNRATETQARQQSTTAFGELISGGKLSWNRKDNTVTYDCQMTMRANAKSVGTLVSVGLSTSGVPVLKATIVYPRMTGQIMNHVFASGDFRVEVELKPDQDTRRPDPQPMPIPVPHARPNNGWVWGAALIATGVVIIVATLVEDAVTAGAGIADDPASFALAGGLIMRGLGAAAATGQVATALVH